LTNAELCRLADERWDDPLVCELVTRLLAFSRPNALPPYAAERRDAFREAFAGRYNEVREKLPDRLRSQAAANEPKPTRRKRERSGVAA
jgi:hypothetical protein